MPKARLLRWLLESRGLRLLEVLELLLLLRRLLELSLWRLLWRLLWRIAGCLLLQTGAREAGVLLLNGLLAEALGLCAILLALLK